MYNITGTVSGVLVAPVADTLMAPERLWGREPLTPTPVAEVMIDTVTVDGAVPDLDESLSQPVLVAVQAIVPEPRLEIFTVWLGGRVCLKGYQMKERWVGLDSDRLHRCHAERCGRRAGRSLGSTGPEG